MIKKIGLPIQLILVITFALFVGGSLPTYSAQLLYTFSLLFKEILSFFLPAIIFSFVLSGILSFRKNAPYVLLVLFSLIVSSNIMVSMTSFSIGKLMLPFLTFGSAAQDLIATTTIDPLYVLSLPKIISSEIALLAALLMGMLFSFFPIAGIGQASLRLKQTVEFILNRTLIPFLPIYVLGFLIKLVHEGTIYELFSSYGRAFLLILCVQAFAATVVYMIAARGIFTEFKRFLSNSAASYLTAFSTMSSTAAVPVTVESAVKNCNNRPLANVSIPIMANVHLMGDAVTVPLFSLVTLAMFGGVIPTLYASFTFTLYFCLAMLATSGVPGGGIIVVIPFLQSILGFSSEMVSVITALYLLQDSFGTACNVLGDGALTIIADRILKSFGLFSPQE